MDVGELRVDPRRREAYVGDQRLELRPREFELLAALARDPGVVWSRDDLLSSVWGTDFPGETRTVDVHVSELRRKLGDDAPPIETDHFPTRTGVLCDWCAYQDICPAFANENGSDV